MDFSSWSYCHSRPTIAWLDGKILPAQCTPDFDFPSSNTLAFTDGGCKDITRSYRTSFFPWGAILYVVVSYLSQTVVSLAMTDNGPQITQAIRSALKEDYNYDSTVQWLLLLLQRVANTSLEFILRTLAVIHAVCFHRGGRRDSVLQE